MKRFMLWSLARFAPDGDAGAPPPAAGGGNPPPPAGGGGGGNPPPPAQPTGFEWHGDLPEELRGNEVFARDGFKAKVTDLETQVATLTTDKATLEAKVTTLEQQVKDAAPTPAQLRDAAKAYALTAGRAKALGVAITDAMDEPAIMKAVVTAKMGDAAKDWNDAQIAASFAVLSKDVKVQDADPLRSAISDATSVEDAFDPVALREKRKAELRDGWKQPAAGNA